MRRIPFRLPQIDRHNLLPLAAGAVFAVAAATILLALAFESFGGYAPCPLCLEQRWAYYAGVPLAGAAALLALYERRDAAVLALTLVGAGFLINAGLGLYHAGIEVRWWPGPASCAGEQFTMPTGNLLEAVKETTVIRCDQAPWRFLGLSFAGYNAIVSAGLAAIAFLGAVFGARQAEDG